MNRGTLAMGAILVLTSCAPVGGEPYTCQSTVSCRGTPVQTCCTTMQCEYRHEGMVTPCAGTDCVAAAALVLNDCPCLDASIIDLDANVDAAPPDDAAFDAASDAGMDAAACTR